MARMDDQEWLRLSAPEKLAEDARTAAALDVDLNAAHRVFYDRALKSRQAVEQAKTDLDACLARHDRDFYAPLKRAALQQATADADNWAARSQSAAAGRLRLTQAEAGDPEFMREFSVLIKDAGSADRLDS